MSSQTPFPLYSMTKKISIVLSIWVLLSAFSATAQDELATEVEVTRPVLSAYTLEAGNSQITETYLSPLHHSGFTFALGYERMQAMKFDPERWVTRLDTRASLARTLNDPARNAYLWNLDFRAAWSMLRRLRIDKDWAVYAGGSTDFNFGTIYLPRNTNNPVSLKASWTINLAAGVAWNHRIGKVPVCVRYLGEMPLTGCFFSPEYGELYYEIYLGNTSGIIRAAHPGNFFRLNNFLSADIRLGSTIIRAGYRCNILSTKASDIVTRRIEHVAVLGFASEWISLSAERRGPAKESKIISAMY